MTTGIDLAAPGRQHPTVAGDVRALVLARLKGPAAALDPDEVVQVVYLRILRKNGQPCAFDPSRARAARAARGLPPSDRDDAGLSKYVYQVTSGVIADLLLAQRREQRGREDDTALEAIADEPSEAPLDLDAAPEEADAREDWFLALCCLEVLGELPSPVPLWQRAIDQRREETAPGHQEPLFASEVIAILGCGSDVPTLTREQVGLLRCGPVGFVRVPAVRSQKPPAASGQGSLW